MFCPKCGKQIHDSASFCEYCGASIVHADDAPQPQPVQAPQPTFQSPAAPVKREKMLMGIIGALLGAAIGCGAIILCSQLGIVAAISGVIMAVCTLKGYELLGGRLSIKGIIVCILIMLVAPYIADTLDWAIVIMREYGEGISLGEAYELVPILLEEGAIDEDLYYENLGMVYIFTALGALGTVIGAIKDAKKK